MLKKYYASVLISAGVVISACSTTHKPGIHEVFQVPENTRFYTASTLWYTDPDDMTSLNYQNGEKLPYGTEVENVEFDKQSVSFAVKGTEKVYTIDLKKDYTLLRMNDYLKQLLTVTNPVEVELDIEPVVFEKIKRGVVEPGMTKDQVLLAYGYPSKHRTPDTSLNTWIYEVDDSTSKRVIFRSGKVLKVINN